MAFPSTSLIKSEIDSALFFHKKYKKFGTKMIDIMSKIMPEIPLSFFSAMVLSERAPFYDLSDIFRREDDAPEYYGYSVTYMS